MLAIEPHAVISTSAGTNPGGGPAAGSLDLEPFVDQRVILEEATNYAGATLESTFYFDPKYYPLLTDLETWNPAKYDFMMDNGLIRANPLESTKFQVLRKLHIVYPADGQDVMTVRKGGRLPVAILVHGNHNATYSSIVPPPSWSGYVMGDHIPSHKGYDNLQRKLASFGIVSIGVDMNVTAILDSPVEMRAELTLGTLDYLRTLDASTTSRFYGRLDFNNVGLMGHSRGGDAVVRAALLNAADFASMRYGIKAVCSVAPTDYTGHASSKNSLSSSAAPFYLVIYGALDGDVSGMKRDEFGTGTSLRYYSFGGTGFGHYDRANTNKAMVFLDGCNHNRFNRYWDSDESLVVDKKLLVSREGHEKLLVDYVGGLFRWKLLGKTKPRSLFDGTVKNSVKAHASFQWSFGQSLRELDEFVLTPGGVVAVATGGTRTATSGAAVQVMANVVDGAPVGDRTNHQTAVLDGPTIAGTTPSQIYKLALSPSPQDWTNYDLFTFRVCADADVSTSGSISLSALPDFTLIFTDQTKSVTVAASSFPNQLSRPVFHEEQNSAGTNQTCTVIRLETLSVDLAKLVNLPPSGIDLQHMVSIAIVSPAGLKHQFFDSLQLIRR
jgi:hypothetical protein